MSQNDFHYDMQSFLGTDDEVVNKTDWTPLKGGGQSAKSHNLFKLNNERLQFRIALRTAIFFIYMSLLGFVLILVSMFGDMIGMEGSGSPLLGGLVGLLFVVAGLFFFNNARVRITIDRSYPAIWRGNIDPAKVMNPDSIDGYASLKKLHAIQVIQEDISRTDDKSFESYEINLVLHDGKRVHVIDHGDREKIIEQASQLADFLSVPLWDGCRFEEYESGIRIPAFVGRGLELYSWAKISFAVVVAGIFIWTIYQDLRTSKEEEKSYQALPVQHKVEIARAHTKELFVAAKSATYNRDRLKTLIERGADVNEKDEKGRTPLFYAVMSKNSNMVYFLIKNYADIHTKDNEGTGLKDLLDPKKDQQLYFVLEDAELAEKASAQGKTISGVSRTLDHAGNVKSIQVVYR